VKNKFCRNIINLVFGFLIVILLIYSVSAIYFHTSKTISNLTEDRINLFEYNLTANVSYTVDDVPISFDLRNITSDLYPDISPAFYYWMNLNSTTGIFQINSTQDNETGRFNVSIEVKDKLDSGNFDWFYFIVNATNDAPIFRIIENNYNLTQNQSFITYINATDEENHFPLSFDVNFVNCSLAPWSTKSNCSLFYFLNVNNISGLVNITPQKNDVGTYTANISVMDSGINYTCISGYCEYNYSRNMTTYYTTLVNFTIFSALETDISNCQDKIFSQNQSGQCAINITTSDIANEFNVSSLAFTKNYLGPVFNSSWFYYFNKSVSSNYTSMIIINVTPQVTEVGNFTINFTLWDINSSLSLMTPINIYVNKTINFPPIIENISNQVTSINYSFVIPITVYDDDMLIPDKNMNLGGYNESLNFTAVILNQSNLSQVLDINGHSNLTVSILTMPVSETNRTLTQIAFIPNSTSFGNFTINLTAIDLSGIFDSKLFNLTVLDNNPPNWSNEMNTTMILNENTPFYFNFSTYVSDPDLDSLNFSFSSDNSFPSFNLNILTGISSFTPSDLDVGEHTVTVSVTDAFYAVPKVFYFTVYNLNETPYIVRPIQNSDLINATVDLSSNIVVEEKSDVTINLWVQDDDFKIPVLQRGFYNENLTFNLTIEGQNTNLFNFTKDNSFPVPGNNRSKFYATFTPQKADIGTYNLTVNVTDNSGLSDLMRFNLTIIPVNNRPTIINLTNMTTAVNRSFYYPINATDLEDGNSTTPGNTNLTFIYNFLSGTDFINNNSTIFNTTTGELRVIFNESQAGTYRLNITVNDSSGKTDSKNFWIFVYDVPRLNYPNSSYEFNFTENSTNFITFNVNHTMRNNMTYLVYLNNINLNGDFSQVLYNQSFYGNGTNLTIPFNPDFNNETYGVKYLTFMVYPTDSSISNPLLVNQTINFPITITHTNFPVSFVNNIGGSAMSIVGGSPQSLILSDYFFDLDVLDVYYNQTILFNYSLINSSLGSITVNLANWTNRTIPQMNFSSGVTSSSLYSVTAYETHESNPSIIVRTLTSNNFTINLTVSQVTIVTPSSGGGGSTPTPVSFKIVSPGVISALVNERITVPLKIVNYGKTDFREIKITTEAYKDKMITNLIKNSLDQNSFSSLRVGESKDFKLNLFFNTNKTGDYEILLNASSINPSYNDWVKIYVNLRTINKSEAEKYILFTEEYIVENPQCIELKELVKEANTYLEKGDYSKAMAKAEEAITACKEYVSQVSLPKSTAPAKSNTFNYLLFATIGAFVLGIFYYIMQRRRFSQTIRMS
jgi:hypothetical protein